MRKVCYFLCIYIILLFIGGCSEETNDQKTGPNISLNKSSLILEKGKSERLIASFTPEDTPNQGHIWNSSASNIATVDETGMVSAVGLGECIITVTALDGKKVAKCQLTVTDKIVKVTGIILKEADATMIVGNNMQLEAIIVPNTATDKTIMWSSSNNKIASVDRQGIVTAITEGETTITAKTNDGEKTASCKIKVWAEGVDISKPKVSDITSVSALVTGTIKTFGLQTEETGICYSTVQMPTINETKVALSNTTIAYLLNELTPETTYYVRIYAKIKGEVHYGEEGVFATTGLIKTHFEPTDIYVDKITLVSPSVSGIATLNVCYGKFPNPKITDYVTTATRGSDGKYHVTLAGLEKGTTYYMRPYSRVGSIVDYYEDEVSAQTIGKDFSISRKVDRYEKYDWFDQQQFVYPRYRTYYTYTYNIKFIGTYLVETSYYYYLSITKSTNYSESIYIQNGTGTFAVKQEMGMWSYEGASTYIDFLSDKEILFTNIENKLRYHLIVPQKCYVRSY